MKTNFLSREMEWINYLSYYCIYTLKFNGHNWFNFNKSGIRLLFCCSLKIYEYFYSESRDNAGIHHCKNFDTIFCMFIWYEHTKSIYYENKETHWTLSWCKLQFSFNSLVKMSSKFKFSNKTINLVFLYWLEKCPLKSH